MRRYSVVEAYGNSGRQKAAGAAEIVMFALEREGCRYGNGFAGVRAPTVRKRR